MTSTISTLLRRTILASGAVCALLIGAPAAAQSITLSGGASATCTWSAITMAPNGSISVTCTGTTQPPPPDNTLTFTLTGPSSVLINTYPTYKIKRTGGTAGVIAQFGYGVSGVGCGWMSQGPLSLDKDQEMALGVFPIAVGTCSISFGVQDGAVAVPASKAMDITVTSTPPAPVCPGDPSCPVVDPATDYSQPVPTVAGCPTAPATSRLRKLAFGDVMRAPTLPGQEYLNSAMNSGEVMAIKIPASPSGRASVTLMQGQGTVAPPQPVSELTVSRCPGVIETSLTNNTCYTRTNSVNYGAITAYNRALAERGTDQSAYWDGCLIPAGGEQYYVNVRWTFPSCPFGPKTCAFTLQWSEGPN